MSSLMKEGIDQMFQKDVFAMCKCDAPIMVVPRKEHVAGVSFASCPDCGDYDDLEKYYGEFTILHTKKEKEAAELLESKESADGSKIMKAVENIFDKYINPAFKAEPTEWAKHAELGKSPKDIADKLNDLYKDQTKDDRTTFLNQIRGTYAKPKTHTEVIVAMQAIIANGGWIK